MNYQYIAKNYPNAFNLARIWWGKGYCNLVSCPSPVVNYPKDPHILVEFFDLKDIHIDTDWLYEAMLDSGIYEAKIYTKNEYPDYIFCTDEYPSRSEAESKAIMRAFEILEKSLIEIEK